MGGTGEQSADSWLSDFYGGQSMNTTPSMVEGFGGNMANMDSVADNDQLSGFMQGIGRGVSSFGSTGQRLFCPINITPFMPYYLSGLDGVEWRMGYPISDLRYSKQILNPLSSDGIGTSVKDQLSLGELTFSLPAIGSVYLSFLLELSPKISTIEAKSEVNSGSINEGFNEECANFRHNPKGDGYFPRLLR